MIKLVYCLRKKWGLTDHEFSRYWHEVHGPLGARIPGLKRLVQSHPHRAAHSAFMPEFDGMAELWFDDMAALGRARLSPEWAESTAYESNFIDPDYVALFVTEEKEVTVGAGEDTQFVLALELAAGIGASGSIC
jgi:uncharacterized protein (TIGR02118 family)